MRTIRVELAAPCLDPGTDLVGETRISTEVIVAGDAPDDARQAGIEARDFLFAFVDGYTEPRTYG